MRNSLIEQVEAAHIKTDVPHIEVGDTVDVHVRIIEGEKQRVQVFTGVIIALKGSGINRVITVRRIVANEGVERVFPVHSPKVAKIDVQRHAHVRRSKLYYLRDRVGKKRRLRDRQRGLEATARIEADINAANEQAAASRAQAAPTEQATEAAE